MTGPARCGKGPGKRGSGYQPEVAQRPAPLPSVAGIAAGAVALAWAGATLMHRPELRVPLAAAVAVLGALAVAAHAFRLRRMRPVLDLEDALAPVMTPDSLHGFVRVTRRHRGRPSRVRIRYPADFEDRDAKAREAVRDIISTRLGAPVTAIWQRSRRKLVCIVDLGAEHGAMVESDAPDFVEAGTADQQYMRTRASEVVQAVMGATAHVRVEFEEGSNDPSSISVVYGTTARDLAAPFRQRVLMQITQKLPGDWRDIWNFEENRVRFEKRPPFPTNIPYPIESTFAYGELPYAASEDGTIRTWILGSKHPHHLIVGPTGSGKTVLIRALVLGAAMQGIPVLLMDPKRTEYLDFESMPNVTLLTSTEDIADGIMVAADLMDSRYAEIEAGVKTSGRHGKMLVVLDEYAVFKSRVNKMWEQQKKQAGLRGAKDHECLARYADIVLMGRTAELHTVLGLQRPDAEIVQGILRDSFRRRTALDQHSRETAAMMWGNVRTGTRLPSIQGRAMSDTGQGPEEVQVLRVIPPTAGGNDEDARIWQHATQRAAAPGLGADVRLPDALATLTRRRRRAISALRSIHGTAPAPAPVSFDKSGPSPAPAAGELPADTDPDSEHTGDQAPDGPTGAVLEEAGAYELAEDDVVMIEDETGIPERAVITDLTYTEDDDGTEWIEITLLTEDGTEEVREISAEETLTRSPRPT